MERAPEVITMGEVLVEIMRPRADQPLDEIGTFVGPFPSGARAIFAVATARLGLDSGFIGAVGADAFARLLQERFRQEGVDATQLQRVPGYATAVAFVAYAGDGSREFVFHLRHAAAGAVEVDALEPAFFERVQWLHLSGSTLALNENSREAARRVLSLAQARGGLLSFDPNFRPELLLPAEALTLFEPFLEAAALILPTAAEAQLLTGFKDAEAAGRALLARGARLVAIKQGAGGAIFCTADGVVRAPGYAVEEVDATGAGDCFNASCVWGLKQGWELEKIARFATAAGALAVTRQGPMEGAPTTASVLKLL